jgi:hypothetical protein
MVEGAPNPRTPAAQRCHARVGARTSARALLRHPESPNTEFNCGRCPISERRLALDAEDLIGTWRLRSWKNVASDGSAVDPLGEKPVGYIFYNHDGYMSVEIMARHRAPYHDPDAFGGTLEERAEAIGSYLSYCGPFEVLPDRDTVIHHIEVCSYPNWIGNAQVRFAKLEGELLTLSTKPMTFQGVERTAELVWERVGHD